MKDCKHLVLTFVICCLASDDCWLPIEDQPISPAYAEVDCLTGVYTKYRYRFVEDPIVIRHLLVSTVDGRSVDGQSLIADWRGVCLYA